MNKRLDLKIYGKVQGVFYRIKTKETAKELNLFGFVKNNDDGTVSITAEGDEDNLIKLIDWCRKGTSFAKVNEINLNWRQYTGEFKNFNIKY